MASRGRPAHWPEDAVERATAERRAVLGEADLSARSGWRDGILTRLAAFKKRSGLAT